MDPSILKIVFGTIAGLTFLAVFALGYVIFTRPQNLGRRVQETEQTHGFDWLRVLKSSERIFKPLGEMIPRSPEEMSRQEQRFVHAGIRRRDAPLLFYGIKLVLAVLLLTTSVLTGYFRTNPVLFIALSVLLGAMVPDLWLNSLIRGRKERLQQALPDMLDLAVVCVEAGLGMDQSLLRIGQELSSVHPEISEELNLYSLEVNAGRKRADALRNLGNRTDVDDLKSFVAVLIQTDRFGTSIAQSLRVFSETLRTKRRQRAEEHAAKMSIKMLPPLVFFIFPAILIVILGPAIIAVIRVLLPGLSGR
jgi:tight adherence protein C